MKPRKSVHNFSLYKLTNEEEHISSYGLDHHIEAKLNANKIKTDFEAMYHHLEKQVTDLSSHEKDSLKSKVRTTCENYIKIAIPEIHDKTCEEKWYTETDQRWHRRRDVQYKKIYPSGSNPGKFDGTAKVHKLSSEVEMNINNVDRLPLRPIVSNINTATYKTS